MSCSAGMMIVNKMALRAVGLPITVVMIQMAFTVLFICASPCTLHFGSARDVLRWACTVPFLFTLMLASSMLALDHASMGAIVVVRNVAPLVTMAVEGFFGEAVQIDCWTVVSLLYIIGGVVLYVSTDISFSPQGMGYMLVNMVASVLERIIQRKLIALTPIDVSKTGMMLINNAVSLVLMLPVLFYFDEFSRWYRLRQLSQQSMALLVGSCVTAVAISWAGINAQSYVTATTFMVLTNLNKFVVIGFGMFILNEARTWQAYAGCLIALSGGLWYARIRSQPQPSKVSVSDKGADERDSLVNCAK
mmetsp:Transcript_10696/g.23802  ORF Transcript_10696/g.23802 Transcript_10696/m.23802 type:complete len:305 (-) Transcript_10696:301-1215(-)